eukprot:TRINITY_DN2211_c0_g1_i3.p1 TRINITY_DN2211_c0_g1~~TRINITY_DN2211_c0_g1_i3.p1  ORF type:complete len:1734 (-),score=312.63 TRINITY_DN2211_c0_g1_i3:863-6064(-)
MNISSDGQIGVGKGVEDMITLNNLTEDLLLKNLQTRYEQDLIYTYCGTILVAINPFRMLPIFTQEYVNQYVGKRIGQAPPHIFAVGEDCYSKMRDTKSNQSVLISGESGAGKTVTMKLILQYLAAMTNKHSEVEGKILESNPVMEAFGNAKTGRNNNSSRFGKFIEIHFGSDGFIKGARIIQYLLEKSRLVFQSQGERNFHIFYMFMAGATAEEKAKYQLLSKPEDYNYLNQSGCTTADGIDDVKEWKDLRSAMVALELGEENVDNLLKIVSSVMLLGNLKFTEKGDGGSDVANKDVVKVVGELLGLAPAGIGKQLTSREMKVMKNVLSIPLNAQQASDTRDGLVKTIYSKLFDWIIDAINKNIYKEENAKCDFIGLLDIFGFEQFDVNSFEQFCINFANEKLQQHFNQTIFKQEQEEYDREGIDYSNIEFKDNILCIELVESRRPPGIFCLLDEACKFPKATDDTFLEKLHQNHEKHENYEKPKRGFQTTFVIHHYAGAVPYSHTGFLDKNRDIVQPDTLAFLKTSTVPLLVAIFDNVQTDMKKSVTLGTNFKNQMIQLMTTIGATESHYVRCIKPNSLKVPSNFDQEMVLAQLRYAGMLETIKIRQKGYPIRFPMKDFFARYKCLAPAVKVEGGDFKKACQGLCDAKPDNKENWQVGKTKVFMRDAHYNFLEEQRDIALQDTVLFLECWWRMVAARQRIVDIKNGSVIVQAAWRMYQEQVLFQRKRKAAVLFQSVARMLKLRQKFKKDLKKKREEDEKRKNMSEEEVAELEKQDAIRRQAEVDGDLDAEAAALEAERAAAAEALAGSAPPDTGDDEEEEVEEKPKKKKPKCRLCRKTGHRTKNCPTYRQRRKPMMKRTLPANPPERITKKEARKFTMKAYADYCFNMQKKGRLFGKKKIKVEELLSHSKKPLDQPLHKNIKPEAIPIALEFNKKINAYMEREKNVNQNESMLMLQNIVAGGLKHFELRDELYAQVIKQTTNNPNRWANLRGWEILAAMSSTYPPSENYINFVQSYLHQHFDKVGNTSEHARFCDLRMRYMLCPELANLPRKSVPGLQELKAVLLREKIPVKFYLTDGGTVALKLDSHNTAAEIYGDLAKKSGLKDPTEFAIYVEYPGSDNLEYALGSDDYLVDLMADAERKYSALLKEKNTPVFKFWFKKKLYLEPDKLSGDTREDTLEFYQAHMNVIDCKLPVKVDDACVLAALKMKVDHGDMADLLSYMPPYISNTRSVDQLSKKMVIHYNEMSGKGEAEARTEYLKYIKGLPLYGKTLFKVRHESDWTLPKEFFVAISVEGIKLVEDETWDTLRNFDYTALTKWSHDPRRLVLTFMVKGYNRDLEMFTSQSADAVSLLEDYMFWLRADSNHCEVQEDYYVKDKHLLRLKKGDVLEILRKGSSGWWKGKTKDGKVGKFPSDIVEMLLAPPGQPSRKSVSRMRTSVMSLGDMEEDGEKRKTFNARSSMMQRSNITKKSGVPDYRFSLAVALRKVDTKKFSMKKFAEEYFNPYAMSSGKKRTQSSLDSLLQFSSDPIKEPLLKSSMKSPQLSQVAVDTFLAIMKFMEDYPVGKRTVLSLLQEVIQNGLDNVDLRDEIFCQILKQTTENENFISRIRGFDLLAISCGSFPPSQRFYTYLSGFLQANSNPSDQEEDIVRLSKAALERLAKVRMKGNRLFAPSAHEFDALEVGDHIPVNVFTLDGEMQTLQILSSTTVNELMGAVTRNLEMTKHYRFRNIRAMR